METGKIIAFRPAVSEDDVTPHLAALKRKKIGKNDSDRIRMALRAFTELKGIRVPA